MDIASITVEEVAQRYGGTLAVFSRHGIDICCGGSKTVREAAALHGVDLPALLKELDAAGVAPATPAAGLR